MELLFEVIKEQDGSYVAACQNPMIFAEASSLQELHDNIHSAIQSQFKDAPSTPNPNQVKLVFYSANKNI